jgi:ParB family transcriptional regulator, chromosome partitioning protein
MFDHQWIALNQLEISPQNVRRTNPKMGLEELKASILAHGLLQNLVVVPAGKKKYEVIAGGRRLEALRSLHNEGKLTADHAVPCQIAEQEQAAELSLAENTVRLAMHPADQFEAFAALIDKGATAGQVAHRFGVEESLVLKRMKLARVAPSLIEAYRKDDLSLECLMAFTITDDQRRQLKVFKSLQDWQKKDPSAIRDILTEKMVDSQSKLALFVGLDAYVKAGGSTRADLFGEEVYLEKPALLQRLAEEKLTGIRSGLEAEGWGWIEVNPERDWSAIYRCERLQPRLVDAPTELIDLKSQLDAKLEEIESALDEEESDEMLEQRESINNQLEAVDQQLAAFVGFDAVHMPLAGCFLSIDPDGSVSLDKGLVKPEHRKALAKLLGKDAVDGVDSKAKRKNPFPETLRRDLAGYRLQVAQVEIAKHPAIAFDLLAFNVASQILDQRPLRGGADVQFRRHALPPAVQKESTLAAAALAAIEKLLPADWRIPESEAERFEAFRALPQSAKLEWLAYCMALTLKPQLAGDGEDDSAYEAALSLTASSVAGYWRPGNESFLARINRESLLAVARDTLGEAWSQSHGSEKKSVLVEKLDRAFANPDKLGKTAGQIEKLRSWLPSGMEFGIAPAAKPAKARKEKAA